MQVLQVLRSCSPYSVNLLLHLHDLHNLHDIKIYDMKPLFIISILLLALLMSIPV